jgi:hypothetical protein
MFFFRVAIVAYLHHSRTTRGPVNSGDLIQCQDSGSFHPAYKLLEFRRWTYVAQYKPDYESKSDRDTICESLTHAYCSRIAFAFQQKQVQDAKIKHDIYPRKTAQSDPVILPLHTDRRCFGLSGMPPLRQGQTGRAGCDWNTPVQVIISPSPTYNYR